MKSIYKISLLIACMAFAGTFSSFAVVKKTTKKTPAASQNSTATSSSAASTTGSSTTSSAATTSSATTANGLKEALSVGVTNAVLALNKENGYFGNEALKIMLPKEAAPIVDNIKLVPGGQNMLNDVVLRMNRAAEDAAGEAKPIFVNAIKNLTIADATSILFGSNKTGATDYLKKNTYGDLTTAFAPKINASLNKNLVGNMSTTDSWTLLTKAYNKVANSFIGKTTGLIPVNSDLGTYVTEQALNGLFITVGNEEAKIRENPVARVSSVLQNVFGLLDKK